MKLKFSKISSKERLYNIDIPIIGLTGGIATGKSACSKIFKEQGLPVICADTLVKNIYQREETIAFIQTEAQETINNNQIDFKLRQKNKIPMTILSVEDSHNWLILECKQHMPTNNLLF